MLRILLLFILVIISSCAHFGAIGSLRGDWYGMSLDEFMDYRGEPQGVQHMKNGEMVIQYTIYPDPLEEMEAYAEQDNLLTYEQVMNPNFRRGRLYERLAPSANYRTTCTEIFFVNREGIIYHWNQYGMKCTEPE